MTTLGHPRFGRCPCSGTYEERSVEVRMTVAGEQILLRDVSQGACPMCGSRVYKTAILGEVEQVMKGLPPSS